MVEGEMIGFGVGVWGWEMEVAILWVGVFDIVDVFLLIVVE